MMIEGKFHVPKVSPDFLPPKTVNITYRDGSASKIINYIIS